LLPEGPTGRVAEHASTMFSLLYGFWQKMFERVEYRVLILGVDKVGKTTLLERIKVNYRVASSVRPATILPTVGLNIARVEDPACRLVFWDLGGQEGLRSIWDKYYREADSVLFVVDCSQEQRLQESLEVLEQCLSNNDLVGIPVLVFANKEDKAGGAGDFGGGEISREMSTSGAGQAFRERLGEAIMDRDIFQNHSNHHVMGGSALEGFGIKEGVKWLVEVMKRNQYS